MTHQQDRVEFVGFESNYELSSIVKEMVERVSSYAPSDAFLLAQLKKTKEGFEGIFKVTSLSGSFLAKAVGIEPTRIVTELGQNVLDQVKTWSRNRTTLF